MNKAAQAVQSLSRIRAAETQESDGLRRVWHQGVDVDLLSYVDPQGCLRRQELTLFGDYFVWTPELGLRTGRVEGVEAATAANASDLVRTDRAPDAARLSRAAEALEVYAGEDRYVLRLKEAIGQALRGIQEAGLPVTVTRDLPQVTSPPAPSAASAPAGRGPLRWILLAAASLMAVGVAVGLLLLQ